MTKKIVIALYTLIVACIGFATVIEKFRGTPFVSENIYGAWWFVALWLMLVISSMAYMFSQKLFKRHATLLLHLSFVVILAGALTTFLSAKRGTVSLRMGLPQTTYTNDDSQVLPLPFTLTLQEFKVINYPGTDAPLDFQSIINVQDKGEAGETSSITVSMNNIGKVSGYRLFQSSYDSDSQGVTLGVYYDPWGIALTYMGYLLLFISMVWVSLSKQNNIRALYRKATKTAAVLLLLMMPAGNVSAQEKQTVDADIANLFGSVNVLYNNRICPVNTVATDFVTKLSGKASWKGYSANEIFMGWMIYYSYWEHLPLIRIKSSEVQRLLGIDGQWASYSDFIDDHNEYKLKASIEAARQGRGDVEMKPLMEADEKYNVVAMFYNGQMLRMFPYAVDGTISWYSPGAQVLPREIPVKESFFIKQSMDFLTESIVTGQKDRSREIIAKIKLFQKEKAGDVMPSESSTNAEIFYNHLNNERWIVFFSLTLSMIFCMVIASGAKMGRKRWFRISVAAFVALLTVYLSLLLALRWWVSGHVPLSNGYETMQFMSWALLLITILSHRTFPIIVAFGPLGASFCLLVAMLAGGNPQITQLMPVLQSPLLTIHVVVVMCAYALFALQMLLAVQVLIMIRRHAADADVERITALSQLMLYPAIFFLTAGIFIGAVWANISWGTYWHWDPKETWALITLMVYAVPMHSQSLKAFRRPKVYHVYMLFAFLSVLITYFGVNMLLGGMHSYANG